MSISKVVHHFSCENVKKPYAIELNIVMFCLGMSLIEIVLYSFLMKVMVACMKRNVEKYTPHGVKM